ncbi:Tex family protein [Tenuifilum thalassicum]|uniref:RNA-binding transcriptional accessory protein n=1 Tax=Tenuifilum thalassicum TaxID=2590900 RepID=A0A7D3XWE9_9BACT|nr:Tex family protein [Tenuifilum thalassicum]QKG80431.1 RNA-binding transcriptional accessory protein [Tenuifilum thalassicum]
MEIINKAKHVELISSELNINSRGVANTIKLLDEGATIPFISRYRKEMTGNLDETQVTAIRDLSNKYVELDKRKETILSTIDEQGKLTDELRARITSCYNPTELEDIYLPYKPKRRTRATIAKEKGLEPLALIIFKQQESNILAKAENFLNDDVSDTDEALAGARDIIAEWISEDEKARNIVRKHFKKAAIIKSKVVKGKETEGIKYSDYFSWEEEVKRCASHRFLAMRRGQDEGFLRVSISPPLEPVVEELERVFIRSKGEAADQMLLAITDSYKRLIEPSIENEFTSELKDKADEEAIRVFAENLRQLLLSPPLGQKSVLAIDPGYRTGCKVVCLDQQGNLLHNETIYPHPPQSEQGKAMSKISALVDTYKIEAIAIGNGTASRETESLIKRIRFNRDVKVFVVSEDGASVYSASAVAREEFPEYDVTVRGAVSIGRRLMDPLAELVKIDPKSIGVGQYQHDVDQNKLKQSLDQVVESCVNHVGVHLNTASKHLLTYVSGLGPQLAKNIVEYRAKNGPFKSRSELKKVPRLGEKAFEQCAGFLRISDAENPLDNTAVHPESYHIVEKMAADLNCSVVDLIQNSDLRSKIKLEKYVTDKVGLPTLNDIMQELSKPGRDPRKNIKVFEFADGIYKIDDLKPGMVLPGIVTNITNFGVFVDVGVKQDGLVHISQLANHFVSNPLDIVKLHQHVKVKVIDVDIARKRIQLSMKDVDQ